MANATKYVDNVNGNNANTGNSEAQAYADIPTAIAAITGGGNKIYVQAGSNYTITSTIAFTAGLKGDTIDGRNRLEGYTTTPGARDGRPVITSATNSVGLFTLNDNDFWEFIHLKMTHTAATRGAAFVAVTSTSTPIAIKDCIIDGCLQLSTSTLFSILYLENIEVTNTTTTTGAIIAPAGLYVFGCDIHDNIGDGIRTIGGTTSTLHLQDCIIDTNAIGINDISTNSNVSYIIRNCTIVDNTGDGVKSAAKPSNTVNWELVNNIIVNNGAFGIEQLDTAGEPEGFMRINHSNAYGWPNSSGPYTGLAAGTNEITLTVDPFVNRAGRNFALNNTAGGGALLRGAGFPKTFPGGTISYHDIGAVQHQDSGSGGIIVTPSMAGVPE